MAIDFPNTPTTNQIYTVGSRSWKWDGTIWAIYSNNPVLYRQDSPPSSPQEGDQWFETDTGRMFVYYGTAWVELGNATDVAGALQPSQVTALSAVTTLTSDDVFPVVDGPSGAVASSKITYGNLVTNMSSSLAPGLVLVKTQTIGSAVASVAVTNAFSADYDNYKVVVTGGVSSGAFASLNLTFGATVTGYHRTGFYMISPGLGFTGIAEVNVSSIVAAGTGTPSSLLMNADIYTPFLAKPTGVKSDTQRQNPNSATFWLQGFLDNTTSYTGFTLTVSSGTITGGTIRVYGVRN
jgi:hypothetical protein